MSQEKKQRADKLGKKNPGRKFLQKLESFFASGKKPSSTDKTEKPTSNLVLALKNRRYREAKHILNTDCSDLDINANTAHGDTALTLAVKASKWPLVHKILQRQPNVNVEVNDFNLLFSLIKAKQTDIIKIILPSLEVISRLHLEEAFASEQWEISAIFLQNEKLAINPTTEKDIFTQLIVKAAQHNQEEIVGLLLEKNAEINLPKQPLPLVEAAKGGHGSMVKKLLAAKADPYLEDKDYKLAFDFDNPKIESILQDYIKKIRKLTKEFLDQLGLYNISLDTIVLIKDYLYSQEEAFLHGLGPPPLEKYQKKNQLVKEYPKFHSLSPSSSEDIKSLRGSSNKSDQSTKLEDVSQSAKKDETYDDDSDNEFIMQNRQSPL